MIYAPGVRRWFPLGVVVVAVVVAVYALFFMSSEEEQIRGRLDQLAEAVRIEEGELNPLVRQGRVREELEDLFTKGASASVAELEDDLQGRDAIISAAIQLAVVYQSAHVSFGDVKVRIDAGGKAAKVSAVARVTGASHGQPSQREKRRVAFQLEKGEGGWRIASATVASAEVAGAREAQGSGITRPGHAGFGNGRPGLPSK